VVVTVMLIVLAVFVNGGQWLHSGGEDDVDSER
jgi:hypothetical protein